jgi:hypothetical protein
LRPFVHLVAALMFVMLAAPAVASAIEPCCAGECESDEGGDGCGECSDCACCAGARAYPIQAALFLGDPAVVIAGPIGTTETLPAGEPREVLHVPKRA